MTLFAQVILVCAEKEQWLCQALIAFWSDRISLVASPTYLEQHGRPTHPDELAAHNCLLNISETLQPKRGWPLLAGGMTAVQGNFSCNDLLTQLEATLRHLGIALLPEPLTRAYRDAGQLETILHDHVGQNWPVSLVFPDREFLPPQVRAFIDHTVEFYANLPYGDSRVDP